MRTECTPPSMRFARLKGRDVVADFGGGAMTSDAGALLLGATDRAIGLVDRHSDCFSGGRSGGRVVHDVAALVGLRHLSRNDQPQRRVQHEAAPRHRGDAKDGVVHAAPHPRSLGARSHGAVPRASRGR